MRASRKSFSWADILSVETCGTRSILKTVPSLGLERHGVFYPIKTVVIGLGDPILGDDGVAWKVAETVRQHIDPCSDIPVDIDFLAVGASA